MSQGLDKGDNLLSRTGCPVRCGIQAGMLETACDPQVHVRAGVTHGIMNPILGSLRSGSNPKPMLP